MSESLSRILEQLGVLTLVLGLGVAPIIYSARRLPWLPVPVAPLGILASLFLSWVGLAVVVMLFIKDVAIYRIVLRNRNAAAGRD